MAGGRHEYYVCAIRFGGFSLCLQIMDTFQCDEVIDIINTVRKMKWSWAGHINRLKDDRWTSRVTTWRRYDK